MKLCIYGLIPYLIGFIYNIIYYNINFLNCIPLFIFINGILFHHYYPNNIIINYYDTLTNIFFYLYMNYYSQVQPYCILLTLLIFCVFYTNQNYLNKSNFIHVFCIQLASLQLYYDANLLK